MELSEKEKLAIEELKHFKKDKDCRYWIGENGIKAIDTISNLIKKLLKEVEETQPIIEVLENFGKNGLGEYSKRYFAEYSAIHHTAFYDFIPDPDEIYKKYYEQKKEIEKLKKENEDLRVQSAIVYLDYQPYKLIAREILEKLNLKLDKLKQEMDKEYDMYGKSDEFLNLDEQYDYLYEIKKIIEGE